MNYEIGLKLYSTNQESLVIIEKLYIKRKFDYIELLTIPGTYAKTIADWKKLDIPVVIHAPHSLYGFDLSDNTQRVSNRKLFSEVRKFSDKLSADIIIVHPGLTGEIGETEWQIKNLSDSRITIENMPNVTLDGKRCLGARPEEIKSILKRTNKNFCLDITHAVKAAYFNYKEYLTYISSFLDLKPKIVHICDTSQSNCYDEHFCLFDGDLDLKNIFKLIKRKLKTVKITLETPEKSYEKLPSFQKNTSKLIELLKGITNNSSSRIDNRKLNYSQDTRT